MTRKSRTMAETDRDFFSGLPEITEFSDILDGGRYYPVPDDWLVVATDIRGSTQAIEAGQYKSVNMAGACAIAAIRNEYPDIDVPFVFGGDGMTLALPDVGRDRVMGLLRYCTDAVEAAFGLELAAGCMTMADLRALGGEVRIGRFRLSDHVRQALFWGNGVDLVEDFVKSPENDLRSHAAVEANFEGLECRWNEIPADKDEILSIIIKSTVGDDGERGRIYRDCFSEIERIYGSARDYAPLSEERMSLAGRPSRLRPEVRIRSYPSNLAGIARYFLKLYYLQLAGSYLMKKGVKTASTDWGDYKPDFVRNADFRKFSDGLKLVVSGTREQGRALRSFLEEQRARERLIFGMHASPTAMTTCLVTDYQGRHIHFIDGSRGGYAAASVELKRQRDRARQPPRTSFSSSFTRKSSA